MSTCIRKLAVVGVAALTLLAAPVLAGVISGTGDPSLDPALLGGTVVGFDSGPTGLHSSLTFGIFTIKGVDAPFTVGAAFIGIFNTRGTYSVYNDFDDVPRSFRFEFSSPVGAFGFLWGASDYTWLLTGYAPGGAVVDSLSLPVVGSSNAGDYFGLTGSAISYATLVNEGTGDYVFIDNFTYLGEIYIIPEPGTWALFGIGLLAMGMRFRRRR